MTWEVINCDGHCHRIILVSRFTQSDNNKRQNSFQKRIEMFADWQMQQKALKDAERQRKKEAAESLANFKGTTSKEQEFLLENGNLKKLDAEKKKGAAAELQKFKGASRVKELDFQKELKKKKDADRKSKKSAEANLNSYQGPVSPTISSKTKVKKKDEVTLSELARSIDEVSTNTKKYNQKKTARKVKEWNPNIESSAKEQNHVEVGKSRKIIDLDFSFGIVCSEGDDPPDMAMLNNAACTIIPRILAGSLNECNIRCDCKAPKPSGEIEEDSWFESKDSIRWKVTGTVPVKLFVEKGKTVQESAAPIQKMLKRHTSFRQDTDGGWKRVREGRLAFGITF